MILNSLSKRVETTAKIFIAKKIIDNNILS